jgi:hypothetical protein
VVASLAMKRIIAGGVVVVVIIVMMMRSRLAARTFPSAPVDGRPSSQFGIDPRDQRRLSTAAFRNPVYSDPENGANNGYHAGPASEGLYDDPEFMGFGFGGLEKADYFDVAPLQGSTDVDACTLSVATPEAEEEQA